VVAGKHRVLKNGVFKTASSPQVAVLPKLSGPLTGLTLGMKIVSYQCLSKMLTVVPHYLWGMCYETPPCPQWMTEATDSIRRYI
jgi:hypothetical protein